MTVLRFRCIWKRPFRRARKFQSLTAGDPGSSRCSALRPQRILLLLHVIILFIDTGSGCRVSQSMWNDSRQVNRNSVTESVARRKEINEKQRCQPQLLMTLVIGISLIPVRPSPPSISHHSCRDQTQKQFITNNIP